MPLEFVNRQMVTRMRRSSLHALLVAALATAWGCDNTVIDNPVTPTVPTTVTENFSSTLTRNGAVMHTFTVSAAGNVIATLTTLSDAAQTVGLDLGTFNGITCSVSLSNPTATQGVSVTGVASGVGALCVRVYDSANRLTDPVDYALTVTHF